MTKRSPVVLVTGVSSGIGRAVADAFAAKGFEVFGTSRNPQRTAPVAGVELVQLDVTDDASVAAAVSTVVQRAGRIDIVVNNAGVGVFGAAEETSVAQAQQLFDTNFFGALRVAQTMLPLLQKSSAGRIVNISSGLGSLTFNSDPAWTGRDVKLIGYNSSKAALNMLTVHLAYELCGTKIKVNSANPGYTKTDLNDNQGTQPVEVGAIEATRLALLDDNGPTGQSFSKDGPDPW